MLSVGDEKRLEEMLVNTNTPQVTQNEMKTDFRKLSAVYNCTADGKWFLCARYVPSCTGACNFLVNEKTCGSEE